MRAPRGRWLKWSIILMFLIVTAPVCAAYVLLDTNWGRQRMREMAVDTIHRELGLDASLGDMRIEGELVPPRVTASAGDIVLDDPVYGPFVEADGLTLRPSLGALLTGEVDLRHVEIDKPELRLVLRDGEIRNLPRVEGSSEGPAELPFGTLVARGARIHIDAEPLAAGQLNALDLRLTAVGERTLDIRAETASGHVEHMRGREELQKLLVDGRVALGERAEVRRLVLRTPHFRAEVSDASAALPPGEGGWEGRTRLKVHLDHLDHLPVAWDLPRLEGWLRARAHLRDRGDGPRGNGHFELSNVAIDDRTLGKRIASDFELTPKQVRLEQGRAHLVKDGGHLELGGAIGLTGDYPLDVRTRLVGVQFDRLMDQLDVSSDAIVSWHLDGTIHLQGTLDPLDFSGPVELHTKDFLVSQDAWHQKPRERVVGVSEADLTATMAVSPNALRFEEVVARTPRSRIESTVHLGFNDQLAVRARSNQLRVVDASPIVNFPIAGAGSMNIRIEGPYGDPAVDGHFELDDFRFDGFRLGHVESDMRLEKGGLAVRFPSIQASKRGSRYRVQDLLLDFTRGRIEVTGAVHAGKLHLQDLYHVFGYEKDERFTQYQGYTRGIIDVRFTHGFPGDSQSGTMRLGLDLDLPQFDIDGLHFTDGQLVGKWVWHDLEQGIRGASLDVQHLELQKGQGTVTASGRMKRGGTLQLTASADELALQKTEGLAEGLPGLQGSYSLFAEIEGDIEMPRYHVDLSLTGLTWQGKPLGDARAYVRMTHVDDPWVQAAREWNPEAPPRDKPCAHARAGLAHADWAPDPPVQTKDGPEPALSKPMAYLICGSGLNGQLGVDLAMGRTSAMPLRGQLTLNDLDVAPFVPGSATGEQLQGGLSGRIHLDDGTLEAPQTLVGRILLSKLRLATERVALRNEAPVDVRIDRGSFDIERARFAGPSSHLKLSGKGSLSQGLALRANGAVDLGLLATMSPRVRQAQGQLDLQVDVTGPMVDPAIYGEAHLRQASFRFASLTRPIEDLSGDVTFSARRVLFENFRAQLAGGSLELEGAATLRDRALAKYHFDVAAQDMSLRPMEGLELGVGAQLRLAWNTGQRLPKLKGNVRINRLLYDRPFNLSPTLGELYKPRRAEVKRYDPEADQLALDVRVVDRGPIRVENNLVEAEIEIEDSERPFRLVGTDQRFGVLGTLDIPRGTVRFRGADFNIRRGTIDFDDRFRVNPNFDVRAVTEVRRVNELTGPNWRITLHAHGTLNAFRLDASSEPDLSQEDLMMLLAVGMTRSEAEQLQAGDLGPAALEALATVTGVDREVQKRLPVIDHFAITSRYSPQTNRTEPQVTIGKRIADRVRLSASRALTSESRDFRAALEWQLDDQASLQAVYDNANEQNASSVGNVGVDLRWRLEFE